MIIDTFNAWGPTELPELVVKITTLQKHAIKKHLEKLPDNEIMQKYAYERLCILSKMLYYKSAQYESEANRIIRETREGLWHGKPQTTRRYVKWDGARYSRKRTIKLIQHRQENRSALKQIISRQCRQKTEMIL